MSWIIDSTHILTKGDSMNESFADFLFDVVAIFSR